MRKLVELLKKVQYGISRLGKRAGIGYRISGEEFSLITWLERVRVRQLGWCRKAQAEQKRLKQSYQTRAFN